MAHVTGTTDNDPLAAPSEFLSDRALRHVQTSNHESALSWDDAGTPTDVETLALVVCDNWAQERFGIVLRGSGAAGSENAWVAQLRGDRDLEIAYYDSGFFNSQGQVGPTPADGEQFWIRFRLSSTTVRAKAWRVHDGEPDWQFDEVVNQVTGSGWAGLFAFDNDGDDKWCLYLSVDAAGGTAPAPDETPGTDQWVTDFSEYATGAQPADWTERWETAGSTWSVEDEAVVNDVVEDGPDVLSSTDLDGFDATPVGDSFGWRSIVLDPDEVNGATEVVHAVHYDGTGSEATIVRARDGTTGREHPAGTAWESGEQQRSRIVGAETLLEGGEAGSQQRSRIVGAETLVEGGTAGSHQRSRVVGVEVMLEVEQIETHYSLGSAVVTATAEAGQDATINWGAAVETPLVDYEVFRRSPATGERFDPEADTPVATGITDTQYVDSGLDAGDYDWQIFARIESE